MKTLFNQYQPQLSICCLKNTSAREVSAAEQKEAAIKAQIEAMAKNNTPAESTDLTDLMNYYLSVAG